MGIEAKPSRAAPGSAVVLAASGGRRALVFGLTWFALVGSHIAPMARARARQLNATHYVAGGLRAASGGCVRLARGARRGELHAAAQAYAHLFSDGAVGSVVALPDGRYWTVAAQDGAVMSRGDRIHPDGPSAEQAMAELRALRPALRMLDGEPVLARLEQTLDAASRPAARWRPAGAACPGPCGSSSRALALAAALPQAWDYARKRAAEPSASAQPGEQACAGRLRCLARRRARAHAARPAPRDAVAAPRAARVRGAGPCSAACVPEGAGGVRCALRARLAAGHPRGPGRRRAGRLARRVRVAGTQRIALAGAGRGRHAGLRLVAPGVRRKSFIDGLQRVSPAFSGAEARAGRALSMPAPRDAQGAARHAAGLAERWAREPSPSPGRCAPSACWPCATPSPALDVLHAARRRRQAPSALSDSVLALTCGTSMELR